VTRRRSVMLDEEHAELLRRLAERYGMSVSAYLRSLVRAAWEAEERGFAAPRLLRRAVIFENLLRLGGVLAPRELLGCVDPLEARSRGRELGSLARRLGLDVLEYIAWVVERLGVGVAEADRVVLLPRGGLRPVVELLAGMAEGAGLAVEGGPEAGYVVAAAPAGGEEGEGG